MPSLKIKRGTRAQINAAGSASQLAIGEIYLITDEARLAVGTSATSYQAVAREGDGGTGLSLAGIRRLQAIAGN